MDDTDEESTIWDAVDEVLICGKGEMIKTLANACFHHGIPKRNIHFELFEEYNDDIYPVEKEFPLIENIEVEFTMLGKKYTTQLPDNKDKILQQLLLQKFPVPYSCKSESAEAVNVLWKKEKWNCWKMNILPKKRKCRDIY